MRKGRCSLILAWAVLLDCLMLGPAFALFGFGSDDAGKSGLDFAGGYDINTVTTVSGKVTTLPQPGGQKHTIIEVITKKERFYLYVGPPSYWEKNGIPVRVNDVVSAKGSKTQGEDGKTYLITQKLTNQTTGAQLEMRNEKGDPAWSGRNQNTLHHNDSIGGSRHMGSGMMRMGRGMKGR